MINQFRPKNQLDTKTLDSNTGLKMQVSTSVLISSQNFIPEVFQTEEKDPEIFCDWITANGKNLSEDQLSELLNQILIGQFWGENFHCEEYDSYTTLFRGGAVYEKTYQNEIGIKLKVLKKESGYTILLSLSGKVLEAVIAKNDFISLCELIKFLTELPLSISRIDLSIDDYSKTNNILDFLNWFCQGNFQGCSSKKLVLSGKGKFYTGVTLYFGSRQSDKSLRIYDTWVKHKKKSLRFEAEFKGIKAKQIQEILLEFANQINTKSLHGCDNLQVKIREKISNLILSTVSFCDKETKPKRINTKLIYPEFSQWKEFKKSINKNFEKVKLVARLQAQSVKAKWDYLDKKVKGTLELFAEGFGLEILLKLVELLVLLSTSKNRPEVIKKDKKLLIASMQKKGIKAIFSDSEQQEIFNKYGIDFGTNTSYYQPKIKEDSLVANKKVLGGLLKQKELDKNNRLRLEKELNNPLENNNYFSENKSTFIYQKLLDNFSIVEFLYQHIPSAFKQLINKLNFEEREIIINHCEFICS